MDADRWVDPSAGSRLNDLPAATRHRFGAGFAWHVSTRPERDTLADLLERVLDEAGAGPDPPCARPEVEAVRRAADDDRTWVVLANLGAVPARAGAP
jgi:beta-galactosidase